MMKKILLFIVVGGLTQIWWQNGGSFVAPKNPPHDEIIMYALTTCGNCARTARGLRERGVVFREVYLDEDEAVEQELHHKMKVARLNTRRYFVPVMDVHGTLLANNPSLDDIQEAIADTR